MNIKKETKAYWGDKFIEILDPHKPGHIIRVYPDYWDEKAPIREQGEPVAWMNDSTPSGIFARHIEGAKNFGCTIPLYTTPQPKQEQSEPVAWFREENGENIYYATKAWDDCLPLYTTPQQRKPLTDEQIVAIVREASHGSAIRRDGSTTMRIARAIEAAHGIKE